MAQAALALDIAVGQEGRVGGAVGLGGLALLDEAVVPEAGEDVLDDGGVLGGRGAAKDVKVDAEPVVDLLVDRVILGAQCGGVDALGQRLGLCRRAVLVRPADVDCWETPGPAEAGKDVCGLEGENNEAWLVTGLGLGWWDYGLGMGWMWGE